MGKPPSEYYWDKNNHRFPFQVTVGHKTPQDPDPRIVQEKVCFHFIRVPFNREAHWGFDTQDNLEKFKRLARIGQK